MIQIKTDMMDFLRMSKNALCNIIMMIQIIIMGFFFYICKKCHRLQCESDDEHENKCNDEPVKNISMDTVERTFGDMRYISRRMLYNFDTFWQCVDYWQDNRETKKDLTAIISFIKNFGYRDDFINYEQTKKDKKENFYDFKKNKIKLTKLPKEITDILK